jgi:uncharacterized RDD family membrane protein YckC
VVTRGVALAVDALAIDVIASLIGALVHLVASWFGHPGTLNAAQLTVGLVLWTTWAGVYFTGFWTLTGQTPGQRVLGIRVAPAAARSISAKRATIRYFGLIASAVPLGAGFVPVLFDGRRRGFHDRLAGTVVIWDDREPGTKRSARQQTPEGTSPPLAEPLQTPSEAPMAASSAASEGRAQPPTAAATAFTRAPRSVAGPDVPVAGD